MHQKTAAGRGVAPPGGRRVTPAEREKIRPLADVVVAALTSHRLVRLPSMRYCPQQGVASLAAVVRGRRRRHCSVRSRIEHGPNMFGVGLSANLALLNGELPDEPRHDLAVRLAAATL